MVKKEEIKLTLFADDMTCFLNDINLYLQSCRSLEDFYEYSGFRINNDKTEIFAIGSFKLTQRDLIHTELTVRVGIVLNNETDFRLGFNNSFSLTKYRINASCQEFGLFMT